MNYSAPNQISKYSKAKTIVSAILNDQTMTVFYINPLPLHPQNTTFHGKTWPFKAK